MIIRPFYFKIFFFFLITIWCFGFLIPILFHRSAFAVSLSPLLKHLYANICHQNEEKILSFFGAKGFVCFRCAGIYLGAFAASLFSFIILPNISVKLLAIPLTLLLLDVFAYTLGLYNYAPLIAFITGLLFGSSLFLYILNTFINYYGNKYHNVL